MGKRQTRRTVSMTAVAYARLGMLAKQRGCSASSIVETMVIVACNEAAVPGIKHEEGVARQELKRDLVEGAGGIFTF